MHNNLPNWFQFYSRLLDANRFLRTDPLSCKVVMPLRSQLRYSSILRARTSSSETRLSRMSRCVRCSRIVNFIVSVVGSVNWFIRRSIFFTYFISISVSEEIFSIWLPAIIIFSTSDTRTFVICAMTNGREANRLNASTRTNNLWRFISSSGSVVKWLLWICRACKLENIKQKIIKLPKSYFKIVI